jgi:hypothetical protein
MDLAGSAHPDSGALVQESRPTPGPPAGDADVVQMYGDREERVPQHGSISRNGVVRMNQKQAHLEMIQGVVNRLSQNSFLLKGWTVVLVSALFALAAKDSTPSFVYLAYLPGIAFWCLDAYYLWQESRFRALYEHVRLLPEDQIDYSMDVEQADVADLSWSGAFVSRTLLAFHGAVLA